MYAKTQGAWSYFIGEPVKHGRFGLFFLRFSQAMHEKTNGLFDLVYAKWAALVRPKIDLPASGVMTESQLQETASTLKRDGCAVLPWALSKEMVKEIHDFALSAPAYGMSNQPPMFQLNPERFPENQGRFHWPMSDIIQLKSVQSVLSDSVMYRIAQDYLGAKPVLTSVTLWLDVPMKERFEPHVYHYDNDGPGFLKFFFYLTDVTETTGAHRFIKGSHGRKKPARLAASERYDEAEVLDVFGPENEVVFVAPAGTIIAEDTEGFHRGTPLQHDHRLIMQIQFSLIDIPHIEEFSRPIEKISLPQLSAGERAIARKFVA